MYLELVKSLNKEQIASMGRIGEYGCANDPGPHMKSRFGLDGANAFQAVPGIALATISQDTQPPKVLMSQTLNS